MNSAVAQIGLDINSEIYGPDITVIYQIYVQKDWMNGLFIVPSKGINTVQSGIG
jgi:hypothetical protein